MSGFKLPLDFSSASANKGFYENNRRIEDAENPEKSIGKSIADFIILLVGSSNGDFKPDVRFGFNMKNCRFTNADSEDRINHRKIEGKSDNLNNYAIDLKDAIKRFEPRLQNPSVKIEFNKKQSEVAIFITGLLAETRKEYKQEIKFHIW
ncbi:MAG: GPW/gp25 family protein [Bacteroidales bacterium]|nr:GPW/gp25 family protein [Bacteroidales bacterium]